MPTWLQVWLSIVLAFITIAVASFVLSTLLTVGERPFTRDEQAGMKETYPGGTFIAPSKYKWCDGRIFQYFDTRGDVWNHGETCYVIPR